MANRQPYREVLAIAALPPALGTAAQLHRLAAGSKIGKKGIQSFSAAQWQQHIQVLPKQLGLRPAEHLLGGVVDLLNTAVAVPADDAVHRGVDDATDVLFAGLYFLIQLVEAHSTVHRADQNAHHQRGEGDQQAEVALLFKLRDVAGFRRTDNAHRCHAGVVHGGNRQPHDHRCHQQGFGGWAAQTEANPERKNGQHHGHYHRAGKPPGVEQ